MASTIPAAAIGLADRGRIAVGYAADSALWSSSLEVTARSSAAPTPYRAPREERPHTCNPPPSPPLYPVEWGKGFEASAGNYRALPHYSLP